MFRMQTRSSSLLNWITRIQNHGKSIVKKIENKLRQIQFNKFKRRPREKWITRITFSKKNNCFTTTQQSSTP